MLRVAVPNKGTLAGPASEMLAEAGYRQRHEQRDLTVIDNANEVEFFFLRPKDIAIYVGSGELDLPEQQMHTTAYWLTVPQPVMAALPYASDDRRDGVVGLSFAMRQVAQLLLMCDRHDIGISLEPADAVEAELAAMRPLAAKIFVYDNYPGGIGFSRPLFDMHDVLLRRTYELISTCPCNSGCPSCVGPEGNTGPHAKEVASQILTMLLAAEAA